MDLPNNGDLKLVWEVIMWWNWVNRKESTWEVQCTVHMWGHSVYTLGEHRTPEPKVN